MAFFFFVFWYPVVLFSTIALAFEANLGSLTSQLYPVDWHWIPSIFKVHWWKMHDLHCSMVLETGTSSEHKRPLKKKAKLHSRAILPNFLGFGKTHASNRWAPNKALRWLQSSGQSSRWSLFQSVLPWNIFCKSLFLLH